MEGWSRSRTGARTCLPIAEAAERLAPKDERSIQQVVRGKSSPRSALPIARVDAGCKNTPVEGEVSLDILLYGRDSMALRRVGVAFEQPPTAGVTLPGQVVPGSLTYREYNPMNAPCGHSGIIHPSRRNA